MEPFVPERLIAAMERRGMTYRGLAVAARLSHTTVWRLLQKDRTRARARTLEALALALGVSRGWLSGEEDRFPGQLSFWPALVPDHSVSPDLLTLQVARAVTPQFRVRAARAAVTAMIDVMVDAGETPGGEMYEILAQLDEARAREVAHAAAQPHALHLWQGRISTPGDRRVSG